MSPIQISQGKPYMTIDGTTYGPSILKRLYPFLARIAGLERALEGALRELDAEVVRLRSQPGWAEPPEGGHRG